MDSDSVSIQGPYMCRFMFLLLTAACVAGPAALAEAAAPVRVATVEGHTLEGILENVSADGLDLTIEGHTRRIAPADVTSVRFVAAQDDAPASRPADSVALYLADGSRFNGGIVKSDTDTIVVETGIASALSVPISRLAGVRFRPDQPGEAAEAFRAALAERHATKDMLFVLQEGDKLSTVRGLLESIHAGGCTFNWRERSVQIDRERAFGVVLATGAGTPPKPDLRCELTDGSVWAGSIAGGDKDAIRLDLAGGQSIKIPLDRIAAMRFRNERLTFLSDLEPASYEFTPWGITRWPYRKDRSVANRPMWIDGRSYERGIGMHSQSKLVYELDEPFTTFAATIGLDDAVGSRGSVIFRVLVDDAEAFNSGPIGGSDEGREVVVPLAGGQRLALVVEFGDDLDVADQADWGNARLIK